MLHSTLAKDRWAEATEGDYPSLIRDKQMVPVKQYASLLVPAGDFIGFLMELNIPKTGFRHISELTSWRGAVCTAATGLKFPRAIRSRG